jgi:hypothetical protein
MAATGVSVRRARRQPRAPLSGYVVTWDVDSRDRAMCAKVRRFVFGDRVVSGGKAYRYPGFVEREDVRYLGQSVLFVSPRDLRTLRTFLRGAGVDHHVTPATLGRISFS